jgi:ACS family hexuronate transporter-like MFS transporter
MKPIRNLRWLIVATLFFASIISYVDRQVLSINAPLIREQFNLTNAQYSYLITSFLVAYTFGYTILGIVVDRLGTRLAFAIFIAGWSVAGIAHAWVLGPLTLALCRFLLGFLEGGAVPAALRGISEWFPTRERAAATGVFAAGTPIGTMIAAPIIAFVTIGFGWRAAFVITGAAGMLWLIAWLRLYHLPENHPRISADERRLISEDSLAMPRSARRSVLALLRKRATWGIVLSHLMVSPVWWFYVFWLPAYLHDERGFSLKDIGGSAWIPFLTGAVGTLFGGWFSGWLLKRTGSLTVARHSVLAIGSLGSLLGIPAALASEAWVCLALISIVTFAICMWATTIVALPADVVPPSSVGSLSGLSGSGGAIGGVLFTLATGWLVDRFSYWPVFCLAAVLPIVGVSILFALLPKVRPIQFDPAPVGRGRSVHEVPQLISRDCEGK